MTKKMTKKQKMETLQFAHDVVIEQMDWAYQTIRDANESKEPAVDRLLAKIKETALAQRYLSEVFFLIGGSVLTQWVYDGYHTIAIKVLSDVMRSLYEADYEGNKDFIDQLENAIEFLETLYSANKKTV